MNEEKLAKWLRLAKERHTKLGSRIEDSSHLSEIVLEYLSLGNAIDKAIEELDRDGAKTKWTIATRGAK